MSASSFGLVERPLMISKCFETLAKTRFHPIARTSVDNASITRRGNSQSWMQQLMHVTLRSTERENCRVFLRANVSSIKIRRQVNSAIAKRRDSRRRTERGVIFLLASAYATFDAIGRNAVYQRSSFPSDLLASSRERVRDHRI